MTITESADKIFMKLENEDFRNCPDWREFLDEIKTLSPRPQYDGEIWSIDISLREEFGKIYRKYFFNKNQEELF